MLRLRRSESTVTVATAVDTSPEGWSSSAGASTTTTSPSREPASASRSRGSDDSTAVPASTCVQPVSPERAMPLSDSHVVGRPDWANDSASVRDSPPPWSPLGVTTATTPPLASTPPTSASARSASTESGFEGSTASARTPAARRSPVLRMRGSAWPIPSAIAMPRMIPARIPPASSAAPGSVFAAVVLVVPLGWMPWLRLLAAVCSRATAVASPPFACSVFAAFNSCCFSLVMRWWTSAFTYALRRAVATAADELSE